MKKLALVIAASLFATPVFACPHEDKAEAKDNAPRTADKAKEAPKAKETDKKDDKTAKPAPKKETEKKPEKVSAK